MLHDALKRAGHTVQLAPSAPAPLPGPSVTSLPRSAPKRRAIWPEMVGLYHNIGALRTAESPVVLQFLASRPGEGTSVIAREFAAFAASEETSAVLLIDCNGRAAPPRPSLPTVGRAPCPSLAEVARAGEPIDAAIEPSRIAGHLYEARLADQPNSLLHTNIGAWSAVLDQARQRYRFTPCWIARRSAPIPTRSCWRAAATASSSWSRPKPPAARWYQTTIEMVERFGGKVLGLAFNKRPVLHSALDLPPALIAPRHHAPIPVADRRLRLVGRSRAPCWSRPCALTAWRRRDPGAWAGLVALGVAAVAVLVLRLLVWSVPEAFALIGLVKPSGHAAMAAVVYGTIGFVYGRHLSSRGRDVARILCLLLMVGVPVAMVQLGFHSVSDVLVGAVAGLMALGLSRALAISWGPSGRAGAQRLAVEGGAGRRVVERVDQAGRRRRRQQVADILLDPQVDLGNVGPWHDDGVGAAAAARPGRARRRLPRHRD
ncbi:MAG: phosphatase PAP2 family protein [Pseudomonadota bacterium]